MAAAADSRAGLFRFPVKFVILTLMVAPLLAACGMAHYERQAPGGSRGWRLELVWGAAMLALIAVILWIAASWPGENGSWRATVANGLSRILFLVLTMLAIYLFASRPAWRSWSIVPLLAVCWLDVLTHEPWHADLATVSLSTGPRSGECAFRSRAQHRAVAPDDVALFGAAALLQSGGGHESQFSIRTHSVFLADLNLLDDLPKVDGFFSLNIRESDKVLWLLDSRTGEKLDGLEDLLSVSQTIAPGKVFDWAPRTNYIPIVSLGQAPVFADDVAAFDAIEQGAADFRKVVYLPAGARATVKAGTEASARILAKDFSPARQSIEVETGAATMMVLGQAYYHNWEASVDGTKVPLWRANYAFQAVEVPAGKHRIILRYRDKALLLGELISIVSVLAGLSGWAKMRKRAAGLEPGLVATI